MQIRKCVETDIIPLGRFYDEEVKWLDDHHCNYPLWTYKGYPTQSTVEWTIGEATQFICTEGEEILGSFMLNTDPLGAYDKVPFCNKLQQGEYMILHMLSVSHRHTGKGIAKAMTNFAVDYAKELGIERCYLSNSLSEELKKSDTRKLLIAAAQDKHTARSLEGIFGPIQELLKEHYS